MKRNQSERAKRYNNRKFKEAIAYTAKSKKIGRQKRTPVKEKLQQRKNLRGFEKDLDESYKPDSESLVKPTPEPSQRDS